ncbi:MAG: hypothetical protein ABJI96_18125 [Paracoccaceae bacterium]
MSYDKYLLEESVAEIREHWKGPFHFGAPDGIVVNVTKDQIWGREWASSELLASTSGSLNKKKEGA